MADGEGEGDAGGEAGGRGPEVKTAFPPTDGICQ